MIEKGREIKLAVLINDPEHIFGIEMVDGIRRIADFFKGNQGRFFRVALDAGNGFFAYVLMNGGDAFFFLGCGEPAGINLFQEPGRIGDALVTVKALPGVGRANAGNQLDAEGVDVVGDSRRAAKRLTGFFVIPAVGVSLSCGKRLGVTGLAGQVIVMHIQVGADFSSLAVGKVPVAGDAVGALVRLDLQGDVVEVVADLLLAGEPVTAVEILFALAVQDDLLQQLGRREMVFFRDVLDAAHMESEHGIENDPAQVRR